MLVVFLASCASRRTRRDDPPSVVCWEAGGGDGAATVASGAPEMRRLRCTVASGGLSRTEEFGWAGTPSEHADRARSDTCQGTGRGCGSPAPDVSRQAKRAVQVGCRPRSRAAARVCAQQPDFSWRRLWQRMRRRHGHLMWPERFKGRARGRKGARVLLRRASSQDQNVRTMYVGRVQTAGSGSALSGMLLIDGGDGVRVPRAARAVLQKES